MVIADTDSETQGTPAERPTPEQIDAIAKRYHDAKLDKVSKSLAFEEIEEEAIRMVTEFGIVPPNAEKSRRLTGRLAELTVTKSDQIFIKDDRVNDLRDALASVGRQDFFKRLFTLRSKWETVTDAETALREVSLPKRLAEKVLNLYGRCIDVKAKSPSLKVVMADPAKPAKPARAKRNTDTRRMPSSRDLDRVAEEQRIAEETRGGAK
jgi:hypothetical protein